VDVFFEAMGIAQPGDILVVDNGGKMDEGCVGDMTALEAQACGLSSILIWGCHRDTAELKHIGLPIHSYGTWPSGPLRLEDRKDVVLAFADGVVFAPGQRAEEILAAASTIWQTEQRQAAALRAGKKLSERLRFDEYLAKRSVDPAYTFRRHLRDVGAAIEEWPCVRRQPAVVTAPLAIGFTIASGSHNQGLVSSESRPERDLPTNTQCLCECARSCI
jgi:hypothetical protein